MSSTDAGVQDVGGFSIVGEGRTAYAARCILIALGYFGLARMGNWYLVPPGNISIFWPPGGYLLGMLLLHRPRQWVGILSLVALADLAVGLPVWHPLPVALCNTFLNCSEAAIDAFLIRKFLGDRLTLNHPKEVFGLIVTCLPMSILSGIVGTLMARAAGTADASFTYWRIWFLSDIVGVIQVTPLILAWADFGKLRPFRFQRSRLIEAFLLFAGLVLLSIFIFQMNSINRVYLLPLPYLTLAFMLWAALRFNPAVTATAVLVCCAIALWFTLHGAGPFAMLSPDSADRSLLSQEFMAILSLPCMALAAAIAERRGAQRSLAENEERFKLALRGGDLGLWDLDLQNGKVVFDERSLELIGFASENVPSDSQFLSGLIHPEDLPRVNAVLKAHLDGITHGFEARHRLQSKARGWIWVVARGRVVERNEKGRALRITGTFLDITEQRRTELEKERLEDQLAQAQKMESIGRLAGGIAHDLNNLLTPITVYTELVLLDTTIDPSLQSKLELIQKAGDRAKELTGRLLAFGRKQVLDIRGVNLTELVQEFQQMLMGTIREDIQIQWELSPAIGTIRADPSQIEQVLINLVVNAQDAMPKGGRLCIQTRDQEQEEELPPDAPLGRQGPYVVLSVSDSGTGMDSEVVRHIFEPFFTTKSTGKGTGLGLATVYGIVHQHGGYIGVDSHPGLGTTFRIYFPRVEELPSPVQSPTSGFIPPQGKETVLLVEDDESIRHLSKNLLQQLGYRVLEAQDGVHALEVAERYSESIHLLLTDVIMPRMNGRELFEKLGVLRRDMKVLYMSGYTDRVIAHHGVLEPGCHFLQKPFSIQSFTEKLQEALRA